MPYDIGHWKSVNFQYVSGCALSDYFDAQTPNNIHHMKKVSLHYVSTYALADYSIV
jgi:hypothetical protein